MKSWRVTVKMSTARHRAPGIYRFLVLFVPMILLSLVLFWFLHGVPLNYAFGKQACVPRGDNIQSVENVPSLLYQGKKLERSSWFGKKAYPFIESKGASWSWLLNFFHSIDNSSDVDGKEFLKNRDGLLKDLNVMSVEFPTAHISTLENFLRNVSKPFLRLLMPRYECSTTLCQPARPNDTVLLRQPSLQLFHDLDIVSLNFLYADIYDVLRILDDIRNVTFLITSVTTEVSASVIDQNYALELYDLFHKMYFNYDWIPVRINASNCYQQRYNCHFSILWQKWTLPTHLQLKYFPPAGNGSFEYELQRLRSFYANPHEDFCKMRQGFGGQSQQYNMLDGIYSVCLDGFIQPINSDNCVVYSFGINYDWTFDDSMHNLGCTVFSFDPSMNYTQHRRNSHHWFFDWGLGKPASHGNWTMMLFQDIVKTINYKTKSAVTIVKMDIETAEWDFIQSSSLEENLRNVDQFIMEIHPSWMMMMQEPNRQAYLMHTLEKLGFVPFVTRRNPIYPDARTGPLHPTNLYLYEISYVNTRQRGV